MRMAVFFVSRCFGFGIITLPLAFLYLHVDGMAQTAELQRFETDGEYVSAEVLERIRETPRFSRPATTRYYLEIRLSKPYEGRTRQIEVSRHEYRTGLPGKIILIRALPGENLQIQYPIPSPNAEKPGLDLEQLLFCLFSLNIAVSLAIFVSAWNAWQNGEVVYVLYDRHKTLAAGNGAVHWLELSTGRRSSSTPFMPASSQMPRMEDMEHGASMKMYRTPIVGYLWWEFSLPFSGGEGVVSLAPRR